MSKRLTIHFEARNNGSTIVPAKRQKRFPKLHDYRKRLRQETAERQRLEDEECVRQHQEELAALQSLSLEELCLRVQKRQCRPAVGAVALKVVADRELQPLSREDLIALKESSRGVIPSVIIDAELHRRKLARKPKKPQRLKDRRRAVPKPPTISQPSEGGSVPVDPARAIPDWWRENGE